MKVKIKESEIINLDEINANEHFVVAKIEGIPCIGMCSNYEDKNSFSFYPLKSGFTRGNSFIPSADIRTAIKRSVIDGNEVHVFHSHKDAFRWLIEN